MTYNSRKNRENEPLWPGLLVPVLLVGGLLILLTFVSCGNRAEQTSDNPSKAADTTLVTEPQDSVVIDLTGEDSVSVFALLRRNHNVDYKTTAMGVFISGIDGLKNGSGVYWIYSINDTTPQVASDKVLTKSGDRVKWHFRKQK